MTQMEEKKEVLTKLSSGVVAHAHAQVVVSCSGDDAFSDTLAFFTSKLGFRVEIIFPADDPNIAVIVGLGVRLRLERRDHHHSVPPPSLVLTCEDLSTVQELFGGSNVITAPNGSTITLIPSDPPLVIPPLQQQLVINKLGNGKDAYKMGRAGMEYRDLIPGRLNGRFIASHIRIIDGGPVPDYCHFHKVRFQLIFCVKGWVRVVYEDQGDPFDLHAGDCVLQPPRIRHRVLESSPGLEVVEIGSPAVHDTCGDLHISLPTQVLNPQRKFGGQRFIRHVAAEANWSPSKQFIGFIERDTGIGGATDGLGGVRVLKVDHAASFPASSWYHDGEFALFFVLGGSISIVLDDREGKAIHETFSHGDTIVVPEKMKARWTNGSEDLEILFVSLPDPLPVKCE